MIAKREAARRKRGTDADRERLSDFLSSKRWFGDKGSVIRDAELCDVIPVTWPGSTKEFAVARAKVVTDAGTTYYQLFLGDDSLSDALGDQTFRRGLVDAFSTGASFEDGGTRWVVESETTKPLVAPAHAKVTLSSAEQTNSSIVIEGEAILKLYRKLERGLNPDVEVGRFLTIERQFIHVPALLGTIRFEDEKGSTTAGMLQELVPGAVDGWSFALQCAGDHLEGKQGSAPTTSMPFEAEAFQLGAVTREMHDALASGAPGTGFDLRRAGRGDVDRWSANASATIDRALTALDRAVADKRVPRDQVAAAGEVAARRAQFSTWLADAARALSADAGANTRTHGDYHLGQVLRSTADRFLIIDFEGEPARPLEERRSRHSPLRDVAGMLRSFAYAAASARSGKREAGSALAERWESAIRSAFLRGYFSNRSGRGTLLPRSDANAERLIALFEAEKIFYELQYELDHRPDWVWIPLQGIAKLNT